MPINNILVALGFTIIHFNSKRLRLYKITTQQFTSFVGGISVAYLIFYLLPSLSHYHSDVAKMFDLTTAHSNHLIVSAVLTGAVLYYILERALQTAKITMGTKKKEGRYNVFWTHIASYFGYNFIVGILLSQQNFETTVTAIFYLIAIGIHFLTNDWVLRHHFEKQYDAYGRKIICSAILFGLAFGMLFHVHHAIIGLLEAFIAGSMIINAMKDELPHCKGKGLPPFFTGLAAYSVILLAL